MRQFQPLNQRFGFQIDLDPPGGGDFEEFIAPSGKLPDDYVATRDISPADLLNPFKMGSYGTPTIRDGRITGEVPPRYTLGDEWEPSTRSWDPPRIADLQAQLVDAGLLDPDDFRRGFWDQESAKAYRELLGYSNVSGLDSHQTLQRIAEVKAKYGDTKTKGAIRKPFISELTDPARLNSLLDDVSVRLMGRGLTPEEKARFSDSFRSAQETAQRQDYEMRGSGLGGGPGGSVTMPDEQGRAEQFVYETRPKDIAVNQYLESFKVFENLIARTMR